ncbi:hypothetical protein GGX14DRAFT_454281 [Mycena pura]|uniref:Uncharacterized protein n=1 Tax=Mycena pura TaxID=153505 RepID=A0AAD6VDL9_9AGAR|nr:hypothetical protein GGX14DRAFT_454281 [Mycena pura]
MDPKFPPELEQRIFELASVLHPRSMPKLLRVAQRVNTWIQPLLHRVLSIAAPQPGLEPTGDDAAFTLRHPFTDIERLLAFVSKPASSSLRANIRHIRFPGTCLQQHVAQLLSACPAAVDVVLPLHTLPRSILALLQPLPLRPQMLSSCGKFAYLTHLEIRDWREHHETFEGWEGLALIPRLTHLCFHELDAMITVIMLCLQHCKSLAVLVVACSTPSHIHATQKRLESARDMLPGDPRFLVVPSRPPVTSDPRFLVLLVRNYYHDVGWEARARGGGEDFWAVADRHVRKRRSGATNDYVAGLENYN